MKINAPLAVAVALALGACAGRAGTSEGSASLTTATYSQVQ